jgi:hypothetical protein
MDMDKYFRQLVGCKIVSFYFQEDDYGARDWPVFIIQKPNSEGGGELMVSLSQDEEGNGGGFAFIEENIITASID